MNHHHAEKIPSLKTRTLPLSFRLIVNYLTGRITPTRLLNNLAIAELMPNLKGTIIEIGATRYGNHKRFSDPHQQYVTSNIMPEQGCILLDAMEMSLPDNSVDNFVSVVSLEHMSYPWKAIDEIHRTLKPGGKLLLVVPFMYPFHAAPSDYFRFSYEGLEIMLKKFKIIHQEALGNIFSTCALFLQHPLSNNISQSNVKKKYIKNFMAILIIALCRVVGIIFYLLSFVIQSPDNYTSLYCFLVKKRN